jgi:hypothetical protein
MYIANVPQNQGESLKQFSNSNQPSKTRPYAYRIRKNQ